MRKLMMVSLALLLLPATSVLADQGMMLSGYVDGVFQAVQGPKISDPTTTGWNTSFGNASEARLWASGQPSDNVGFTAEMYYRQTSTQVVLNQAQIDWKLMGDQCTVYFGKFWYPFGLESHYQYSTTNELVTRPTTSGIIGWADNGFGLKGKYSQGDMGVNWNVAVSNGLNGGLSPQTTDANNNNKAIGGQLSFMPMGDQLAVGGSFAFGKYDASAKNKYILAGGHLNYTWMKQLNVRGEYFWSKADKADFGGNDLTAMGFYAQGSYKMDVPGYNYFEPVVRFSWMDPDTKNDETVVPGSNTDRISQIAVGAGFSPVANFVIKGEFDVNNEDSSRKVDNNAFMLQAVYGWK